MTYATASDAARPSFVAGVSTADLAALVLRVSTGILFLAHAGLKFFVFTPAGTAGFFESLGFPGPLAYLVIAAELLGGIALVLGVWTRWVSTGAGASSARLDLRPARCGRVLLLQRGRRLGVSGLLGSRADRPGPAGRWRLRPPARPGLTVIHAPDRGRLARNRPRIATSQSPFLRTLSCS